jgi:hypothetical protein
VTKFWLILTSRNGNHETAICSMSAFGAKRKARVIKISDDDEGADSAPGSGPSEDTGPGKFSALTLLNFS